MGIRHTPLPPVVRRKSIRTKIRSGNVL